MTDRISLSALWDESIAFARAEAALLAPVACLGFGLPLVVLLLAVPADQAQNGVLPGGPWMLWLIPCGLFCMTGSLAVSAMALRPGASVGECLGIAFARVPAGIGLFALNVALQLLLSLPMLLLTGAEARLTGAGLEDAMRGTLPMLGNFAVLALMIWLFVRLMPIWALLSDQGGTPVRTVRACLALTRGHYRRLLLLRVAAAVAGVVTMAVLLIPSGALAALLGAVAGAGAFATVLSYLLTGLVFAGLATIWTVYVARLYRRLSASSSGI